MKIKTIFSIVFVLFVVIMSFLAGKDMQKRNNMQDFADWNLRLAESEAELIKANTTHQEGIQHKQNELDEANHTIAVINEQYAEMEYNFEQSHQDPNIPDAPVDELIIFVPDISEPEIIEIIKLVDREFVDECVYPYTDKINGYSIDLNVRYVSKDGLFYFVPQNPHIRLQEQPVIRKTELSVWWYGNSSGTVNFQYDILPVLPIGFSGGVIESNFVAGVSVGFRF